MKIPARILRGLELSLRLSHADIECAEPDDFTRRERADHAAARAWLLENQRKDRK